MQRPNSNIFDLPAREIDVSINQGDALMVFRPGGELETMTIGFDQDIVDGMADKDVHNMTEQELDMTEQGQTLFLLTMAYKSEAIMDLLRRLAQMPGEANNQKLNQAMVMH